MVQAHYQYAIDVMLTRLRMIDADLTGKNERTFDQKSVQQDQNY